MPATMHGRLWLKIPNLLRHFYSWPRYFLTMALRERRPFGNCLKWIQPLYLYYMALGQTLSRTKPAEAISYLKAVIESDPLSYPVYHVLGKSYQRLGMYDEALVAHKKAV